MLLDDGTPPHVSPSPNNNLPGFHPKVGKAHRRVFCDGHRSSWLYPAIGDVHGIDDRNTVVGVVRLVECAPERPGAECRVLSEWLNFPVLWEYANLRLLVSGPHFHDGPIFFKCFSTRAASVSTSLVSVGSGVA